MPSDEIMASNLHWYRQNLDLPEENYRPLQVGWAGQGGGVDGVSRVGVLMLMALCWYTVWCDVVETHATPYIVLSSSVVTDELSRYHCVGLCQLQKAVL